MKAKIKEALKQEYKNLGLTEEAFDGVAAFGETIGTTEEGIANFVKGAESLLKGYQSSGDKLRTELANTKKELDELRAQQVKQEPPTPPTPDQEPKPDIAAIVADAVAKAVQPLNDKIAAFETAQAVKSTISDAKAKFDANDYVKQYSAEAQDAWERANELNEATGGKMTADELQTKAMGYFNKAVSRKGVDTSKPFKGEPAPNDADFSAQAKLLEEQGVELYRESKN